MRRGFASVAGALCATALLSGCAGSTTSSNEPPTLGLILAYVRENPEDRDFSIAWCETTAAQVASDLHFESFFAGMLDVPESAGGNAMCAAMIEAAIAGEVTEQDLERFGEADEIENAAAAGDLLRALLIAHERLKTEQVLNPPATPPGSSRPG